MKDIRSIVVKIVLGSFSLAALLGIIALLTGGSLDGTPGKVLMTTLLVGVESIAELCYLSTARTRFALLGAAGGVVSLVPLSITLVLVWGDFDPDADWIWRAVCIGVTVAASIAQACLLLAVAATAHPRVHQMLRASLLAIVVVAVMIIVPILGDSGLDDWYWRLFGVVAILDVLGTIAVAALSRFGVRREPDAADQLTPALQHRIADEAARRGVTPHELISQALEALP